MQVQLVLLQTLLSEETQSPVYVKLIIMTELYLKSGKEKNASQVWSAQVK